MKLTEEEISAIADRLDGIIGDNFHDAMWNTISEREFTLSQDYNTEVSDEDVRKIKAELKLYL
tara:strand:+ start:786 stop:974 length:189 start_codon:yes stop_codon:yes gene_type:complete